MSAVVAIRGLPNKDLIVGYHGITATKARMEGTVEIRAVGLNSSMELSRVVLHLQKVEHIHLLSNHTGLTALKREETTLLCDSLIYKCPLNNTEPVSYKRIPFSMHLPQGEQLLCGSISLPNRCCETTYTLIAKAHLERGPIYEASVPVFVPRFDLLSCFGMYSVPVTKQQLSSDHIVSVRVTLPKTAFGPSDTLPVLVTVAANPDWPSKAKKVKVRKISVKVHETLTFDPQGAVPIVRQKLLAQTSSEPNKSLAGGAFETDINLCLPSFDRRDANGFFARQAFVPNAGFSTTATLYSIQFSLLTTVKLVSAKDVPVNHEIKICPWSSEECEQFVDGIEQSLRDLQYSDLPGGFPYSAGLKYPLGAQGHSYDSSLSTKLLIGQHDHSRIE